VVHNAARPTIFGIVNITRDSFSDGGRFLAAADAVLHAKAQIDAGADILDLGAAASNPLAEPVSPGEEIARLAPVMDCGIDRTRISIDTFSPQTQAWALDQGVGWLNDIQGFPDPGLYPRLARAQARLVVMHNIVRRGIARVTETDPATIMATLFAFFDERLEALMGSGIARERLVVDPGMGHFLGRDPEVSLTVLRNLPELATRYGFPVLVSVSRKSFIRNLAAVDTAASGPATLAAELFAVSRGAGLIRTHDVAALRQALDVWQPLASAHRTSKG
jgi:dihydropteroate synthase type 2